MAGAVQRQGLIREGVERAGGQIEFKLPIPRGGVERAEPRAESARSRVVKLAMSIAMRVMSTTEPPARKTLED